MGLLRQTWAYWHADSPERTWDLVNDALSNEGGKTVKIIGDPINFGGSNAVKPENHPQRAQGWGGGPNSITALVQLTTAHRSWSSSCRIMDMQLTLFFHRE